MHGNGRAGTCSAAEKHAVMTVTRAWRFSLPRFKDLKFDPR
jgi:hypothetical protein